ncbi:unnamed protein product [Absidia cylindrospora]
MSNTTVPEKQPAHNSTQQTYMDQGISIAQLECMNKEVTSDLQAGIGHLQGGRRKSIQEPKGKVKAINVVNIVPAKQVCRVEIDYGDSDGDSDDDSNGDFYGDSDGDFCDEFDGDSGDDLYGDSDGDLGGDSDFDLMVDSHSGRRKDWPKPEDVPLPKPEGVPWLEYGASGWLSGW